MINGLYTTDAIEYYINELNQHKTVGLLSDRKSGKTTVSILIIVNYMVKYNCNSVIVCNKLTNILYVVDNIIKILNDDNNIKCNITYNSKQRFLEFNGLKIHLYSIRTLNIPEIKNCTIVYIDECINGYKSRLYNTSLINSIKPICDVILFSGFCFDEKIDVGGIKIIDNTTITNNTFRLLKIKKLMNGK